MAVDLTFCEVVFGEFINTHTLTIFIVLFEDRPYGQGCNFILLLAPNCVFVLTASDLDRNHAGQRPIKLVIPV